MSLAERIAQEFNTVREEITESDSTAVKLTGSQTIEGVKTFTSSVRGNLVGNSSTATKLATPRKITLSGDVSGNTSFDGSTDVTLSAQVANDSHNHSTSTITGLGTSAKRDVGTGSGTVAAGDDSRLTNSREWTAETVSQSEAEAGTATTRRAWTAQRVRQAIVAWFNGISGTLGRTILSRTTADQVRGDIGLGSAATSSVVQATGTSTTNVMSQKTVTDQLNTKVGLTGNQTIDGIKTFTKSPIVPTPTTNFQSVPLRSTNITVDVGSGQTYTTINQALEYLSSFYPMYKNSGVTATIKLKAGFVMAEQVLVRGLDLGWITIVGENAETVITHTALTVDFTTTDYGFASYPAFGVSKGGTLPRIGQLFRFSAAKVGGNKHGVMAIGAGSSAEITASKGVKNVGTYGIYAYHGSTINAASANASGAGTHGIYAYQGATINANSANASGAGNSGIQAYRGSTINAHLANASGAGTTGIHASQGSTINANSASIQNQTTGSYCIVVLNGSTINAVSANTSGSTVPILSQSANTLTANGIIYK